MLTRRINRAIIFYEQKRIKFMIKQMDKMENFLLAQYNQTKNKYLQNFLQGYLDGMRDQKPLSLAQEQMTLDLYEKHIDTWFTSLWASMDLLRTAETMFKTNDIQKWREAALNI